MLLANLHDFLTEFRGKGMQLVQTADIPNPAPTRTPLGRFDVLSPDTRVTGQWLTKFPRSPHEICRVSNPCSLPVKLAIATVVQHNVASQNKGLCHLSFPKHGGMAILHEPNQICVFSTK